MAQYKSISLYYKAIWLIYLMAAPIYIFSSGYPQPADAVIVLGIIPALIVSFLNSDFKTSPAVLIGLCFVGLTFMINMTHYVFSPDRKFLLSAMYYVYNFSVFLFALNLFKKSPDITNKLTYWGLALSIIFEFCIVLLEYGQEFRSQGTFNNPNQLGYWSLLSLALLIIVKRNQKINLIDILLILLTFSMQVMSLSKAGLVSMFFCAGILFFSRIFGNMHRVGTIFIVTISLVYILIFSPSLIQKISNLNTIEAAYNRLATIGIQEDDSFEGRGYDRIIENPHYLLLGAGEGANWRYSPQAKELHSGLATLIFSYGVLGFILFFVFLFYVFRGSPWRHIFLIIPIMLYGLTHQNIRFTYFWIVIATVYSGRYFVVLNDSSLANNSDIGETPPRKETS